MCQYGKRRKRPGYNILTLSTLLLLISRWSEKVFSIMESAELVERKMFPINVPAWDRTFQKASDLMFIDTVPHSLMLFIGKLINTLHSHEMELMPFQSSGLKQRCRTLSWGPTSIRGAYKIYLKWFYFCHSLGYIVSSQPPGSNCLVT